MPIYVDRSPTWRLPLTLPLAGALLAVSATASLAQSPSAPPIGAIDHPTGPTDVVLSMETGGGMVPFGYLITQAPTFVLYGDNTAVFRPSMDASGSELPAFVKATLSPAQVDALLGYALTQGRLLEAASEYMQVTVTDAPTTVFLVDAGGVKKSVSVYAMDLGGRTGPDAPMYAAFQDLGALLASFEVQVENGQVLSAEPYQPVTYRAVLSEGTLDQAGIIDWPWADLTIDAFEPFDQNPSLRLAGLSPEHIAQVTTIPSGGDPGMPIRAPDGASAYVLQFRPLLPGEDLQPTVLGGKGF